MMDEINREAIWDEFLAEWPIERVRSMTLEEYTNLNRSDAFVYWLEKRTEKLGSIWGGSAFKWGIYKRNTNRPKPGAAGTSANEDYGWYTRYGSTPNEVFLLVRERIIEVIEAAQEGDLERIEGIDVCWPVVKWKLAFLYQDRSAPRIFPVYREKWLFDHYRRAVPGVQRKDVSRAVMYPALLDRYTDRGDLFQIAEYVWTDAKRRAVTHWLLPLHIALPNEEALRLCALSEVTEEDLPASVHEMLDEEDIVEDHQLAVLVGDTIRALGRFTSTEIGAYAWEQTSAEIKVELDPIPSKVIKLSKADVERIWGEAAASESADESGDSQNANADDELALKEGLPRTRRRRALGDPQSLILFGPPGTGKTWATMNRALELIVAPEELATWTEETRKINFRKFQQQGWIEFVTFHQAYGYEEFVEGIRPVMSADATEQIRYELHAGVFKRIALRAAGAGLRRSSTAASAVLGEARFTQLWEELSRRVEEGEIPEAVSQTGIDYALSMSKRGTLLIKRDDEEPLMTEAERDTMRGAMRASVEHMRLLWDHRASLGPLEGWTYQAISDLLRRERNTQGGHHYAAFWIAMKLLEQIDEEIPLAQPDKRSVELKQVQEALDRPDIGSLDFSFTAKTPSYVLIIDEINRGNISKILGELITLIEPDKRLGAAHELKLPLAYSPQHRFAVPPNLHIIGTMNTADRSIALMDVALRRRFRFEEMLPDSEVIRTVLTKEEVKPELVSLVCDVFETINARIRQIFDRDHQIGHAYFLGVRSLADLRAVFADRVIPLLQEYFYGAWERVCAVLGCPYDEEGAPLRRDASVDASGKYKAPMIEAAIEESARLFGYEHDEFEGAVDLRVSELFRPLSAASPIYNEAELAPYFLGILPLDGEAWAERAEAIAGEDAA